MPTTIEVIDSHTGGEPTRLVVGGFPALGGGSMPELRDRFASAHDRLRTAIIGEPRGSDALVGALLVGGVTDADFGVIFFNNVGYLGMCGHGTVGVVATLEWMGRLVPGPYRVATPAGTVTATLVGDGLVSVENVPSSRLRAGVEIRADGRDQRGDIAYGGNWFFLVEVPASELEGQRVSTLTVRTQAIRGSLAAAGIRGADGADIDHIELWSRGSDGVHTNFVLCPGDAWDRSPCGTGTSAHLACLAADGELTPYAVLRTRSVIGSEFEAHYRPADGEDGVVIPTITGRAWVTARSTLVLNDTDPFRWGIR